MKDHDSICGRVAGILERSAGQFDTGQVNFLRELLLEVAGLDGGPTDTQRGIIDEFDRVFAGNERSAGWG